MMCAIIEDLLPASYFSTTLLGVQTDQRVLRHLIVQYLPRLDKLLQEHDIGETWLPSSPRSREPKTVVPVPSLSAEVLRQQRLRPGCRQLMWFPLLLSFTFSPLPFPSPPLPLLFFGSWPTPFQAIPAGHSLVSAPVALVSVGRAVSDHAALVPHGLRQRGAHQTAAAHLGPVLLRGLPGVVPDYTGHAAP